MKRPIKAENAIMHWNKLIIALRAQQGRTLQVFDLGARQKIKSTSMNEDVVFWKWISESTLGLVTDKSVYHWNVMDGTESTPTKVFDRNENLAVCISV
jgi:clathrin heavy chain